MSRAIVTYAVGAHEELLEVALPTFKEFAVRHKYEIVVGDLITDVPPAWSKIPLMIEALNRYDEAVWFDCDLVVADPSEDFPPMRELKTHALVRHFDRFSEVPNSGVWRVTRDCVPLLKKMSELEVFENHGWWEQAALMTLMGYCVPPEGSDYRDTRCRCVRPTVWYDGCEFMRLCWNSHPNYRASRPKIVHCSYRDMTKRLEVMRELVKDPNYNYPKYDPEDADDSE